MCKLQIYITFLVVFVVNPGVLFAADIRLLGASSEMPAIKIEGEIQSGDYERFINLVRLSNGSVGKIYLFSNGGDFYEAMKIGRAVRALELTSEIPGTDASGGPSCISPFSGQMVDDENNCVCASACFLVHIGSIRRQGNFMIVHRPYYEKGLFGELSPKDASVAFDKLQYDSKVYMEEMGVPKNVQDNVLGTSSDSGFLIDIDTVNLYFNDYIPFRHEYLLNKCSKLNTLESIKLSNYLNGEKSLDEYSETEKMDAKQLIERKTLEWKCYVEADKKLRKDAYTQFFKDKLTFKNQ